MGDTIDNLIQELQEQANKGISQTQEIITALPPEAQQEAVEIKEELKEESKKKNNQTEEQVKQNQKDVRKLQRRIRILKKKAGKVVSVKDMTKIGKAQPRPPNDNPNNVRCYIRYNNQGNPYRICSAGGNPTKPPAQITPPIPVNEFLDKLGKTYAELTEGQRREYHRIDMANRRFNDRMNNAPVRDALDEVLREQRRLGGFIAQEQRLQDKLKKQQLQEELNKRKLDYKNILKGKDLKTLTEKDYEKFRNQAKISDKFLKKFKEAGIKVGNVDRLSRKKIKKKTTDIKGNVMTTKKILMNNTEQIKKSEKIIEDGQEIIKETLVGGDIRKRNPKTGKTQTILTF